jgi:hypothetical protein
VFIGRLCLYMLRHSSLLRYYFTPMLRIRIRIRILCVIKSYQYCEIFVFFNLPAFKKMSSQKKDSGAGAGDGFMIGHYKNYKSNIRVHITRSQKFYILSRGQNNISTLYIRRFLTSYYNCRRNTIYFKTRK